MFERKLVTLDIMESGRLVASSSASQQKETVLNTISAVIAARKGSTSSSLRDILKLESCRAFDDFCTKLYLALDDCFESVGQVRYQLARERAFTNFHRVRQERLPLIWAHLFVELKVPPINALQ